MIVASISCGSSTDSSTPGPPEPDANTPVPKPTQLADAPAHVATNNQAPVLDEPTQAAVEATIEKLGGTISRNDQGRITHASFGLTPLTDADTPVLRALTGLEELNLGGTEITDKSLAHLQGMSSLQQLSLFLTGVTDAGLKELAALHSLRRLYIGSNNINDAGLAHLTHLTQLQILDVTGCEALSDAGLIHLQALSELQTLSLQGTNISDAGALQLSRLSKLKELYLPSQVNAATVSKLKTALPDCMIHKARR
jgi:hypothetical protein